MNKKAVRAARVRFKVATMSRYGATGLWGDIDIAQNIAARTGVPVDAVVASNGLDALTYGSRRVSNYKLAQWIKSTYGPATNYTANLCEE